ncbi:GroES-like protein [Bimuria novae-zelandiae CBS 107.79]|uniref:GroES-like protein n=1 Tax=Bimuria novae-zelandiae CBS 107.79 TaxID=1447943 RepID=A0A6A5VI43_9PLEO|nr:GroES-like protein [Bimuria novae-zelandiae CBS 107.79]
MSPPPSTLTPPLSKHQTAITVTQDGALAVSHSAPVPQLLPNKALIRTAAVALNPVDAKMLDYSPAPNTIAGYDFAGTVVALGDEALAKGKLQIGDRVAGMVHGMNSLNPAGGAFAEYVAADADLVLRVPAGMSWAEAATLGMGVSTAVLGLFVELEVPTKLAALGDAEGDKEPTGPFVLVVGGSTATGTRAIQLLKLAGFRAIATCSPRHFGLAKRFGATATFDYHGANTAAAIRAYTQNELAYAFDCVSTAETTQLCYDALGRAGGRYTALEPFRTTVTSKRSLTVSPSWLLALTIFGEKVALDGEYAREALPDHRKVGIEAVVEGSWEDVIKGVDEVRAQNLSGVKLVYMVS